MTLVDTLKLAQALAPAYFKLKPDGAVTWCHVCGKKDAGEFVKFFTPNGETHYAVHHNCMDADWLKTAKYMGEL